MTKEPRDLDAILSHPHLIDKALRQAEEDALRLHKRAGNPIAVWRDGQVVWLAPEEIPVSLESAP
jgi:hypothetical protein